MTGSDEPLSFEPHYNPSTPEGQIEGAGRFARGLRRHRLKRLIGLTVVAVILLPVLVQLVGMVTSSR